MLARKIPTISSLDIQAVIEQAGKSPTGRAQLSLSGELKEREPLQAIINAGQPESYMRPHKHENPDKTEIVVILQGKVALVYFNDQGQIYQAEILEVNGSTRVVRTLPRVWHTTVFLREDSIVLSAIQGPYDEGTHKQLAPWAPAEEDERAGQAYLQSIKEQIQNKL